jgi:hypothetical protein
MRAAFSSGQKRRDPVTGVSHFRSNTDTKNGEAMGIRTPGLLHVIRWQHVHRSTPPQAPVLGRAHEPACVLAGWCTSRVASRSSSSTCIGGAGDQSLFCPWLTGAERGSVRGRERHRSRLRGAPAGRARAVNARERRRFPDERYDGPEKRHGFAVALGEAVDVPDRSPGRPGAGDEPDLGGPVLGRRCCRRRGR